MTKKNAWLAPFLALLVALPGCEQSDGSVLDIGADGAVRGLVWLDRNGDGEVQPSDGPVEDVRVELVAPGGTEALRVARSDASGAFLFSGVPVGDYVARVDSATGGDSLRVLRIDSARVTVALADTPTVLVGFTYPTVPVDSARLRPPETRLFVEGRALNAWSTFADSTVHVRDTTGAILAVRTRPVAVSAGDRVRLLATVGTRASQPVLSDALVFLIAAGSESPVPVGVDAATAASADAGRLDAELVRLDSVVIRDTATSPAGEPVLTVEDASGSVDVVLDRHVRFDLSFPTEVEGTILDVTGLLVPAGSAGEWMVKPRGTADITVGALSYPVMPVADARAEPADTRLQIEGLALNGWNVFGDSTVHVRDATGAIRAVRSPPTAVGAGDSVRVLGTVAALRGQPVLRDVRTTVLQDGLESPAPVEVTAARAATADDGTLDADLVRLDSVVIQDTTRSARGERVLVVEDGTGTADVVLDADVPFFLTFPTTMLGTILDVTGLLVPGETTGEWVVKPRATADVVVGPLSFPTVPVDTARARPTETRLVVQGLALTPWNVFGDSTLHVADATGAIRALRVPPASVAAGDSIELLATTARAFGQPVLKDVRTTVLRTGVVSPPADSVATATAAIADSARLDAGLVRIAGAAVEAATTDVAGNRVLTVDDGSGPLDIVLDRDITFFITVDPLIGATADVTGVLVPDEASPGTWVLKPRRAQDVAVR